MTKWEMYEDQSFYNMYAVRDASDKSFNSPRLFHFNHKSDAEKFIELLNKSNCAEIR
jgi:hypothetical protein